MLSLSSIVYVQVCPATQIFSKQQMSPSELSSCCFCYVFSHMHYFAQFQLQFLLLKGLKRPPFQFLQRKQLNLVPRSSRLTVHQPVEGCIFDVISSLNTKFFQICSSVTGYGELCVCFQPIRIGEILSYITLLDLFPAPLAEFFLRVLRFFPLLKKTTFPTSTSILK